MDRLRAMVVCVLVASLFFAGFTKPSEAGSVRPNQQPQGSGSFLDGLVKAVIQKTAEVVIVTGARVLTHALIKGWSNQASVHSEPQKDYHETKKEIGYSPSQGDLIKISKSSLEPYAVEPINGNKVTWDATYYVMTSSDKKEVKVTETRILKVYDDTKKDFVESEGARVSEDITIAPGTRNAPGTLTLEGNEDEGKYLIGFMVTAKGKSDVTWMPLTITKDKEIIAKAQKEMHDNQPEAKDNITVASASSPGGKDVTYSDNGKTIIITAVKTSLRKQPDSKSKIIAKALKGETYPLVCTKSANGKEWCQITLDDGQEAWVISTSVKVE